MAPTWLTTVAWFYLGVCFVCAAAVTYDIFFNRRRQPMGVMDAVYPITALYFGPFALALYGRWARSPARPAAVPNPRSGSAGSQMARAPHMAIATAGRDNMHAHAKPRWVSMAIEVSHCGAGCTLGDLIAEWLIFALALTIAGRALFAEYAGDYALALALGILFQYSAIAPMRGPRPQGRTHSRREGGFHLTVLLRDRPLWLDGVDGVRVLPGAAPSDAQLGRLLVPDADRHDRRILHLVARERLARQPRNQGAHVTRSSAAWPRSSTSSSDSSSLDTK
jgi:hypothetical protein